MMENYVITYEQGASLFSGYKTIQGNTAKEALKNYYGRNFNRLYGDDGRYATVIIIKGEYDEKRNIIMYRGKCQQLCFS